MATSLARPTVTRAVHLRITPRPTTLGESREIMRLLGNQFGAIEYFKSFRHDLGSVTPESAVVIFRDEAAAEKCLHRSPVRFRMGKATVTVMEEEAEEGEDQQVERRGAAVLSRRRKEEDQTVNEIFAKMGISSENTKEEEDTSIPRGPIGRPFGLDIDQKTPAMSNVSSPSPPPSSSLASTPLFQDNQSTTTTSNPLSSPTQAQPQSQGQQPSSLFPQFLSSSSINTNNSSPDDTSTSTTARIYQLQANPALRHFRDRINMTRYHGHFAVDTKQLGQHDLGKRVPILGLSNIEWRVREKPWWISRKELSREHEGPDRRRSLREIWKESRAASSS